MPPTPGLAGRPEPEEQPELRAAVPIARCSVLEIDDRVWLDFVAENPRSLVFHHPSWLRVLSESYGYRVFALVLANEHGQDVLGLPVAECGRPGRRRWVSVPFADRCPPLLCSELEPSRPAALIEDERIRQRLYRFEVHAALPGSAGYLRSPAVSHLLPLAPDAEMLFSASFRPQVRQHIRKATRLGLEVRLETSQEALTDTYYRLHVRTRKRLGVPVQPRGFFEHFWRHIIEPGLGFVSLAYAGSEAVAGAVILAYNGTVFYKFAASEPAFLHLRPNHLVLWRSIQWACARGYGQLDFGRSDLANRGLRAFKASWGATELPLAYTTFSSRPPSRRWIEASRLFSPVFRQSPEWVVRAAGELLYKRVGY
jgi:CelD/BcsL family acetyltransferase involved in cellulose biosynthesis